MLSSPPLMKEQRRSQRYRHELVVELHDRGGTKKLTAIDVARHGLFLATSDPPHLRHLVQLTVHLPSGPIRAAASVTRALKGQRDHEDGVGIQFFALSEDAKSRWDDFIFQLQRTTPPKGTTRPDFRGREPSGPSPRSPSLAERGSAIQPPHPQHGEPSGATFLVKLKSIERLREFQQTHLAAGGTVLFTPVLRNEGEHVSLIVVHPKSDEEFRLPGVVHKMHNDRPKRLEIHFLHMNAQLLNAFAAFVETGLPPRVQLVTPPTPPSEAHAKSDELDLDFDVVWEESTLDTDDGIARAPGDVTNPPASGPGTKSGMAEPPDTPPMVAPLPNEEDVVAPFEEKLARAPESKAAKPDAVKRAPSFDIGLEPLTVSVRCDQERCTAQPYPVELGPCRGVLGLVADYEAFITNDAKKIVSAPRIATPDERKHRMQEFLKRGGKLDATVDIMTLFGAIALVDPALDAGGKTLKRTRTVERLDAAARKLKVGDAPARTKVKCPDCKEGHLMVERT